IIVIRSVEEFIDADDVRVIELRLHERLAQEALAQVFVGARAVVGDSDGLDDDLARQAAVMPAVNRPHRAVAQLPGDLIIANDLSLNHSFHSPTPLSVHCGLYFTAPAPAPLRVLFAA